MTKKNYNFIPLPLLNEKENKYEYQGIEVKESPGKHGVGVFIKRRAEMKDDKFYHNLLIPYGGIKISKVFIQKNIN